MSLIRPNLARTRDDADQLARDIHDTRKRINRLRPISVDPDNQAAWESLHKERQEVAQDRLDHFHQRDLIQKSDLDRIDKQRQSLREAQAELEAQAARLFDPNQASTDDQRVIHSLHALCDKHPTPFAHFMAQAEHGQVKTALLEQQESLNRQLGELRTQVDWCARWEQQIRNQQEAKYEEMGQVIRTDNRNAIGEAVAEARERARAEDQARSDLRAEFESLAERHGALTEGLEAAEGRHMEREARDRETRRQLEVATAARTAAEELGKQLETRALDAERTLEETQGPSSHVSDLHDRYLQAEVGRAAAEAERGRSSQRVSVLEGSLEQMTLRAEGAETDRERVTADLQAAKQRLDEARSDHDAAQGDAARLHTELGQARIHSSMIERELTEAQARAQSFEDRLGTRVEQHRREQAAANETHASEMARSRDRGHEVAARLARVVAFAARFPSSGLAPALHDTQWVDAWSQNLRASLEWPTLPDPPPVAAFPYRVVLAASIPADALADQSPEMALAVFAAACAVNDPLAVAWSLAGPLPRRAEPVLRACLPCVLAHMDQHPLALVLLWQLVDQLRRLTGTRRIDEVARIPRPLWTRRGLIARAIADDLWADAPDPWPTRAWQSLKDAARPGMILECPEYRIMRHDHLACIVDRQQPPHVFAFPLQRARVRLSTTGSLRIEGLPEPFRTWTLWPEAVPDPETGELILPPMEVTDWLGELPTECFTGSS